MTHALHPSEPEPGDWTTNPPTAKLAADLVILAHNPHDDRTNVLLIQRDPTDPTDPYAGMWALPGGGVDPDETFRQAAIRELAEETGLTFPTPPSPELLGVFDAPDRDPRGRVVSVAYILLLDSTTRYKPRAGSDAAAVAWHPLTTIRPTSNPTSVQLAFDHADILTAAVAHFNANTPPHPLHPKVGALTDVARAEARFQAETATLRVLHITGSPTTTHNTTQAATPLSVTTPTNPLDGITAANAITQAAQAVTRQFAAHARGAGASWHDIALHLDMAADISDSHDHQDCDHSTDVCHVVDIAGMAFLSITIGVTFPWECHSCHQTITDYGPHGDPNDSAEGDEHGHAPHCPRHLANAHTITA